jgi:fermentation-respiration switch protein FrsA (DUF1100 family)
MKHGLTYYIKLILVGATWTLILLFFGSQLLFVYFLTRPVQSSICCWTPADLGFEYEDVTLRTPDGLSLSGWYLPSQNRAAVILLHGYSADRLGMVKPAEILARHGYGVLMYDLRGHGESQGSWRALGWPDDRDVEGALVFLRDRPEVDRDRIGLLGFSIGGQVGLRASALQEEIKAVIADDPGFVSERDLPTPTNWQEVLTYLVVWLDGRFISWRNGIKPPPAVVDLIGEISPRPVMLIATGDDASRGLIKHYYNLAIAPKSLWEVPDASHGSVPMIHPVEYENRIISYYNQWLLTEVQP